MDRYNPSLLRFCFRDTLDGRGVSIENCNSDSTLRPQYQPMIDRPTYPNPSPSINSTKAFQVAIIFQPPFPPFSSRIPHRPTSHAPASRTAGGL